MNDDAGRHGRNKKLPAFLKAPTKVLIAVGAIVLVTEFLIMLLIRSIHATIQKDDFLANVNWDLVDPLLLTAIVAPALYYLIYRTLNQQAELERQLDELCSFQQLGIGRELRMKELAEENTALRNQLPAEPAGAISVANGSAEATHHAAEHPVTAQQSEEGQRSALLFMLEDLEALRRKIEHAHQEWKAALDVVDDPIFLHDKEFRILRCNKAYQQRAGIPYEQIIGQPYYRIFPKADAPLPCCLRAMEKAEEEEEEEEEVTVGDAIYRSRSFFVHDEQGIYLYSVHILEDATERKQAEVTIQHANRALATLSAVNHELVHAGDENELLQAICQIIVEQHGYQMAWVGYVQHDAGKSIKIMAHAGPNDYLEAMQITWAETERGLGPCGRAVRSGATQLCQDIANGQQYLPWREEALKRGLVCNITLPLKNSDNTVFGLLNVYAGEVNAFIPAEVYLLEEMAEDTAFGVHSLNVRHERDIALIENQKQLVQLTFQNKEKEKHAAELIFANKELQDSLEDTMRVIASIVEMRDPYTAGHQVRVADLAEAIARQMELPEEQVHAIHLASTVHDLGKINIPAEILSKPGKITGIEHSLIKIHPQAGYDILKGIDFPWPIAQMVLQHHERMDGSGYPQGLKGDAILLEARILAVADVVEAMSSHRPYRPGLGIEAALEEITRNRGKFYDSQVADTCLTLFRERGYNFPG